MIKYPNVWCGGKGKGAGAWVLVRAGFTENSIGGPL